MLFMMINSWRNFNFFLYISHTINLQLVSYLPINHLQLVPVQNKQIDYTHKFLHAVDIEIENFN